MEPRRDAGDNPEGMFDAQGQHQQASMEPRRDAGDNVNDLATVPVAANPLQWSPGVMPGITRPQHGVPKVLIWELQWSPGVMPGITSQAPTPW